MEAQLHLELPGGADVYGNPPYAIAEKGWYYVACPAGGTKTRRPPPFSTHANHAKRALKRSDKRISAKSLAAGRGIARHLRGRRASGSRW